VTFTATPTATSVSSCNTGGRTQCCEQVGDAGSSGASPILLGLGIVVQGPDYLIGISYSPVVVGEDCSNTCVLRREKDRQCLSS